MKVRMLSSILAASALVMLSKAQGPCTAMDNGTFLSTKPTLNMDISEATDSELAANPAMHRAQLRVNGQVNAQGPQGIILEVQPDYQFFNPEDSFRFEHQSGVNYLQMYKAVDRDGPTASMDDDINTFGFTLKCSLQSNTSNYNLFDARIVITDKNDNIPMFVNLPTTLALNELTPLNTTVLKISAEDKDLTENLTYSIVPQTQLTDNMSSMFGINPLTGELSLKGQLDYETMSTGFLHLSVMDDGSPARSTTATLSVTIVDGDDQGPAYVYQGCWTHRERCSWPKYTTSSVLKKGQALRVFPVPNKVQSHVSIRAKDLDRAANPIQFSIASTIPPGKEDMFSVTTKATGTNGEYEATITSQHDMPVEHGFEIFLQAEEQSEQKRFEVAMIFFEDPQYVCKPDSGSQTGTNNNSNSSTETYSRPVIALIVVVAILAALLLCLALAFFFAIRNRPAGSSSGDVNMGSSANGSARL